MTPLRCFFRLALCLSALSVAALAGAQTSTIPITGNLNQILGTPVPYASVQIELYNCPSPARVPGSATIVQSSVIFQADASGQINATIVPNDLIDCAGTTGASKYAVTYIVNGVPTSMSPACYQTAHTQASWNMNVQFSVDCSGTPPNPSDQIFTNVNISGCLSIQGGPCYPSTPSGGGGGGGGGSVNSVIGGNGISVSGTPSDVVVNNAGVTMILAGSGVSVDHGQGTVTISASGGGGVSGGTAGQVAVYNSPNSVGSVSAVSIAQGGTGQTTAAAAIAALGGLPQLNGITGMIFQDGPGSTRRVLQSDIITTLAFVPADIGNDLSDILHPYKAITNLFAGSGIVNVQLLANNASGNPSPVNVGSGLTYTAPASTGGVLGVSFHSTANTFSSCPTITFTGGGGSGATATATCETFGPTVWQIDSIAITNAGAGYTSAPTVVSSPAGLTATAIIGTPGTINFNSTQTSPIIAPSFSTGPGGNKISAGAFLPATCTVGDVFFYTGAASVWQMPQLCTATNTWTVFSSRHSYMKSFTPTVIGGSGVGAGTGLVVNLDAGSTDGQGFVNVTPASSTTAPAANVGVVTIQFGGTYITPPGCNWWPANGASAALSGTSQVYESQSSATVSLNVLKVGSTALIAGTPYKWGYSCD